MIYDHKGIDGDILNIIGFVDSSFAYMFRKFEPIKRMIISRDNGLLYDYFSIVKGQLIDLFYFCTIGHKENDEPQTYPVYENGTDTLIWVEESDVKNYKSGKISYSDVYKDNIPNIAEEVPYIHNTEELDYWLKGCYNIKNYLGSHEDYDIFRKSILNIVRACFTIRECREHTVYFKFKEKDEELKLQLRHFLIMVILWNPMVELNDFDVLDESFVIRDYENDIPHIDNFINYKLIDVLRDYHIKSTTLNYNISVVLYNLRQISTDFSLIMGLNFDIKTFTDLYTSNEEVRDIMECHFAPTMQPHDIEQTLNQYQAKLIEIMMSDPENGVGVILKSGTGIKHKQLTEMLIAESLKPSLEGITIPKPIENSTMLRGLDRPSYLYLDASGARKSLVMNKKVINDLSQYIVICITNIFNCWELLMGLSAAITLFNDYRKLEEAIRVHNYGNLMPHRNMGEDIV